MAVFLGALMLYPYWIVLYNNCTEMPFREPNNRHCREIGKWTLICIMIWFSVHCSVDNYSIMNQVFVMPCTVQLKYLCWGNIGERHWSRYNKIPWRYDIKELLAWASYRIRKIAGCACAGNAGNIFPRHWFQRKPLVSDPGMHHGTCVTHVPWCMSGSLTRGGGKTCPALPAQAQPAVLCIL